MKISIFLGHPAHFHVFKNFAVLMDKKGHSVHFVIKQKDILESLLQHAGFSYSVIREKERSNSTKFGLMLSLLKMDVNMFKYLTKNKPDILIGTYINLLIRLKKTVLIAVNEDDASVVPLYASMAYPGAGAILNPTFCNSGKWDKKAVKYNSYQKMAYLHPNQFTPDANIVKKYFPTDTPYFLLRFAKLNAHHDSGVAGINTKIAQQLIDILTPYGNIYITSERGLEPQFEKYRLNINPLDIHHVMAFAKLYIGDSQSMAVEAAMLGTPSIRFNSFAGKIGVLEELEHVYHLTYGINAAEPEKLYEKINELLAIDNLEEEFQARRQKMLKDKIDLTAFFAWFVENYPESKTIMKKNPDYQYNFKGI